MDLFLANLASWMIWNDPDRTQLSRGVCIKGDNFVLQATYLKNSQFTLVKLIQPHVLCYWDDAQL